MSGIIDCEMHIGDEVFVHGYIDEIRNDTIIIRNVGGYFGTSRDEVFYYEEDERGYGTMNEADCKTEPQTSPTISKMEQVDEPQYDAEDQFCIEHNCPHFYQFGGCMNQGNCPYDEDEPQTEIEIIACPIVDEFEMCERMYRDEPQTNADQHVQHVQRVESVEPMWTKEKHEAFYTFLWNVINPNEMEDYIGMFETKDEPQTERSNDAE